MDSGRKTDDRGRDSTGGKGIAGEKKTTVKMFF